MQTGERLRSLDLLKTFAIFFVVWGHCLQYVLGGNTFEVPVYAWIKSFNMPLFMVLAGLFAQKGLECSSLIDYFRKRGQRLLLPVLSWGLILFVIDAIIRGDNSIDRLLNDIVYESIWFLKCLFACGLLALLALKPKSNKCCWILLSLILSQFIPFWNISIMYPCYLFGMVITKYYEVIWKNRTLILVVSGVTFAMLSVSMAFTPSFWIVTRGLKGALISGGIFSGEFIPLIKDILIRNYGQILSGASASLFLIVGVRVLSEKFKTPKILNYVADMGMYTLGVYLVQTILIEKFLQIAITSRLDPTVPIVYIYTPLISLVSVWTFVEMTRYISKKYNFVAVFLFGEKLKPTVKKLELDK